MSNPVRAKARAFAEKHCIYAFRLTNGLTKEYSKTLASAPVGYFRSAFEAPLPRRRSRSSIHARSQASVRDWAKRDCPGMDSSRV
jgi:hypothetical protein